MIGRLATRSGAAAAGILAACLLSSLPDRAAAQAKHSTRYATVPAPTEIENVGPFWGGHDIASLVAHAARAPERGEFESSELFAARHARWLASYAYGKVRLGDRIAVSGLLFGRNTIDFWPHYRYDPDNEVFRICTGERQYEYARDVKALGTYVGSNAFGVKRKITRRRISSILVTFSGTKMSDPCFVPVGMSRIDAARNTKLAGWALIGRLQEPYLSVESESTSPTITHPYEDDTTSFVLVLEVEEAIAFDIKTGRVFYRRKWDEPLTPVEEAMVRCAAEPDRAESAACGKKVFDCHNWYASDQNAFRRCIEAPAR